MLNTFWHDESGTTSPDQLSYVDGVRIRTPGISVNICPHIGKSLTRRGYSSELLSQSYGMAKDQYPNSDDLDAGSLARWADPSYRSIYSSIWSGEPEKHDPYDLTLRKEANPKSFPGPAHSSILRTFQGWLALTEAGPGDGSLMVYPNVKIPLAYMLLRPLFEPPENKEDLMDAEKWTMNLESNWFFGTFSDDNQLLSSESHPHLRLEECLVSIPKMYPGDMVFWHTDVGQTFTTQSTLEALKSLTLINRCVTRSR